MISELTWQSLWSQILQRMCQWTHPSPLLPVYTSEPLGQASRAESLASLVSWCVTSLLVSDYPQTLVFEKLLRHRPSWNFLWYIHWSLSLTSVKTLILLMKHHVSWHIGLSLPFPLGRTYRSGHTSLTYAESWILPTLQLQHSVQQWLLMVHPRTGVQKDLVSWGKLACNTSKSTSLLHTSTHASV